MCSSHFKLHRIYIARAALKQLLEYKACKPHLQLMDPNPKVCEVRSPKDGSNRFKSPHVKMLGTAIHVQDSETASHLMALMSEVNLQQNMLMKGKQISQCFVF